jgi:hypothetical protein
MANPLIAFDESGNTGQDLISPTQPIFSLASVHLSDSETEEAIKILAVCEGKEIKFSSLIRSAAGRQRVLSFLQSPYAKLDKAKTYVIHKRYMVVGKIVDLLIEPLAHRDGLNLYQQGCNIAMANLYYTCLPTVCGEDEFTDFLTKFVEMIRKKDEFSIMKFYDSCARMYHCAKVAGFKEDLAVMFKSIELIDEVLRASDVTQLDPSVTSFIQHCDAWGSCLNCAFDVIYDESKSIRQQQTLLSILMAKDEQQVQVGYDYRKMILPLKATGINFGDSKEVKQLQIADVIAGASTYWARGFTGAKADRYFSDQLEEHGIRSLVIGCIWPSADVTPKDLGTEEIGGTDMIDYIADLIARQERKREHS